MTNVPEQKIVDRDAEAGGLEQLLRFDSPKRVYVIGDVNGAGKSETMRKLRYLCETRFDVPAALVALEDFEGRPDELAMTEHIVAQLEDRGLPFAEFRRLKSARDLKNASAFVPPRPGLGTVLATGAQVTGEALVAGTVIQVEHAASVSPYGAWTDEANREAGRQCSAAFASELKQHARNRPLVILVDTIDLPSEALTTWVYVKLVKAHVVEMAGESKLIVVLAGVDAHTTVADRFHTWLDRFEFRPALDRLREEHLDELIRVHGFEVLLLQYRTFLRAALFEHNMTLGDVMGFAERLKAKHQ